MANQANRMPNTAGEAWMIPISDRRLWGNEAADDEPTEILASYFVNQDRFKDFLDPECRLSIARARKGVGKSALLRLSAHSLPKNDESIVISVKGPDLIALRPLRPMTTAENIYDWQQRLCALINSELGQRIGVALSSDEIAIVETAELAGMKSRNLVGSLITRLGGKLGPVQLHTEEPQNHRALLQRLDANRNWRVWVLIDDIDEGFTLNDETCLRLSSFFTACRDFISSFQGINIRACVRTDVWTSIRDTDQSLDKCEQYIFDILWTKRQTARILAQRIVSYENRFGITLGSSNVDVKSSHELSIFQNERARLIATGQIKPDHDEQAIEVENLEDAKEVDLLNILEKVFTRKFTQGNNDVYCFQLLHNYSAGRPRWAAQLCRMAGEEAEKVRDDVIKIGHIQQVMHRYGEGRLRDLAREHKHQCPKISLIVNAFSRQHIRYTTTQLLTFINRTVLQNMTVVIDDYETKDAVSVARFLYRIGFLEAFVWHPKHRVRRYYAHENKPDLLQDWSNIDDGMTWQIHISYQAALELER